MAFAIGAIGASIGRPTTDQEHVLGTRINGTAGTTYVYAHADGAISAGDAVTIDASGEVTRATIANAMAGKQIGFAQVAFSDNQYGWIAISGNPLNVLVSATSTLNVALYIGTVSGHLSTTAGSATMSGVALQTASTTAAVSLFTAIVNWPKVKADGL